MTHLLRADSQHLALKRKQRREIDALPPGGAGTTPEDAASGCEDTGSMSRSSKPPVTTALRSLGGGPGELARLAGKNHGERVNMATERKLLCLSYR